MEAHEDPYLELLCSAFSRIRAEYGEILRMRENTDTFDFSLGFFNDTIYVSSVKRGNIC